MHTLTGRLLFAHRYPRGRRANFGVFSVPGSAGAGTGVQNRVECLDSEPPVPQGPIIFYRMRPIAPAFRPKPVCRCPRLLKTPKNARRILHQASAARRRIARPPQLPQEAPGLTFQIFPQDGRTPPREARSGVLTYPRTIWEVSPGASDESSSSRGYSSPKLMPNALASRTRSLWGSTYLSLPATSSSGMWHILPSRRAIM